MLEQYGKCWEYSKRFDGLNSVCDRSYSHLSANFELRGVAPPHPLPTLAASAALTASCTWACRAVTSAWREVTLSGGREVEGVDLLQDGGAGERRGGDGDQGERGGLWGRLPWRVSNTVQFRMAEFPELRSRHMEAGPAETMCPMFLLQ